MLSSAQKGGFSLYSSSDIPDKHYMPKMSPSFGAGMEIFFKPCSKSPLQLTLDYNGAYYALKTINTTYYFPEGEPTKTDVSYSSATNKFMVGLKYIPQLKERMVLPYAAVSAGLNVMRSRITIEDPEEGGCEALENKVVFSRTGFIYSGGGGLLLNTSIFSKKHSCFYSYIDVGCRFTGGSKTEYINVNYMQDEPHGPASHNTSSATSTQRDYYAQFINIQSQNIHEHKIAEVYSTPISMWSLRLGYTIVF